MKQTILFYVNSSGGLGFGAAARLNALTALTLQCDVAVELSDSLTGFPARRLKLQAGNWIAPNLQPTQSFFTKGALQTFLEWSLTEFQGSNISLVFSSHGFAGRRIQNIGMKFSVRSVYSWCWNHLAAPPQILQLPVLRRDADTSTGGLYIGPIRDAISGALNGKSILQVVAFDACAMGTVEVIDALHPFALTIVGSVVDTVDMNWGNNRGRTTDNFPLILDPARAPAIPRFQASRFSQEQRDRNSIRCWLETQSSCRKGAALTEQ